MKRNIKVGCCERCIATLSDKQKLAKPKLYPFDMEDVLPWWRTTRKLLIEIRFSAYSRV